MRSFANIIKWDLILIYKYGIVAVAFAISGIYSISLLLADIEGMEKLVAALIFSDPVMYGFLFTAIMILFEKDAQTHQVLAVTPLSIKKYIWSKAFTFTLLAFVCSTIILLSASPGEFHPLLFLLAVSFSSILFVFIGIIGVSFVNNFNQFILLMPIVLAPVCLPFLDYFNLLESWVFYLIPTQACLLLFTASISKIEIWQLIYSIVYLIICNWACYKLAVKLYKKRILKTSRDE